MVLALASKLALKAVQTAERTTESLQPVMLRQIELLDKVVAVNSTRDPLAFQAIQSMGAVYPGDEVVYDPSDEAEAIREAERLGIEPEGMIDGDPDFLRNLLG